LPAAVSPAERPLTVCLYCGSRFGDDPAFRTAAVEFGRGVAERGMTLIYGGGRVGLMGLAADAAIAAGGRVVGIIPRFLDAREIGHPALAELMLVETMHERKARMAELSDAFVALPGGIGTLDETFEIITWAQLGLHAKPIFAVDLGGYWQPLFEMLKRTETAGFAHPGQGELLGRCASVAEALARLDALAPGEDGSGLSRA
jgi:uncharacterized protein (TIGR00730 family)